MKFTRIGMAAIALVVIAALIAGCSSSPAATPSATTTPGSAPVATQPAGPPAAQAASSGSAAPAAGSSVGAGDLFGGLAYNWVEYKIQGGSAGQQMTMYIKWEKTGKCTMRFEGAGVQGMPTSMDCSSTGNTQSNPNDAPANSDVKYTYVGPDVVTVPAGTFTADKYTATVNGAVSTFWIVKGKPLVKMVGSSGDGSSTMELNGMG